MTYRGTVKDGVIVLDEPVRLPNGAAVRVEVEPTPELLASLRKGLTDLAGTAPGLPPDMAAQHDHYIHGTPRK